MAIVWLNRLPYGPRPMHIVLAFDQMVNAATGGDMDETIRSRAGRLRKDGREWECALCWVLNLLDKNHCDNSIGR